MGEALVVEIDQALVLDVLLSRGLVDLAGFGPGRDNKVFGATAARG